jgi:PAS domain S-box-containing protein
MPFLSALSLNNVLETLPIGLFIVNLNQEIVYWNPAAERITGFSSQEAVGQHCDFLRGIPCGRRCGLYDPAKPKPIIGTSCTIRDREGLRLTLSKSVDFLYGDDGRVIGGVESFVDISEMKGLERRLRRHAYEREREVRRRTRELEEERAQLRTANRELDAFVYTVSHDLRSPLTPIIGYAEFLRDHYRDQLDDQALGLLGEIEGQGRRMLSLMEDLLTLARVGRIEPPSEPLSLTDVVYEVLGELRSTIAESGVEIHVGSLPAVRVPRTLISEVVLNLVLNALRYGGPKGGPIEIGTSKKGNTCGFFVRDHGSGVPAEEREKIFDPFFRGEKFRDIKGTGIGLAIVRKVARLYAGRAWVEETPSGGATFHIEFPTSTCKSPGS